jgi:SAM-dependent methyltransferase
MTNPLTPATADNWDRHWEHYSESAESNPAQRYRRRIVSKLLRRYGCAGQVRILDIGSGQGDLAADLRQAFPDGEIGGIELSEAGVNIAAHKVPSARFLQRDLLQPANDLGPLGGWAQFAVCSEVLEHLDDPELLLKNAATYLADGCTLLVTVPGGPKSAFDLHIGHRRHYTPTMLRELLESSGFTVLRATTAGFPFFNLYRLVVILRGRRLIADVDSAEQGFAAILARAVMGIFRWLFAFNLTGTTLGWQTIAVARVNRAGGRRH